MLNTKYVAAAAISCAISFIHAQQDPLYSMYMFDKLLINPAYAGSSNWAVGTLKYREQARSFEGHPTTQTFNFHAPLQRKRLGIGLKIINDQLPIQRTLNGSLFLSYHLGFAGGKLSAGFEGGMLRQTLNYSDLILNRSGDNTIPSDNVTGTIPDLNAGLYFQKAQFYMGFSAAHLLSSSSADPMIAPGMHLYLLAGNVFVFKRDWSVDPSVLVKYIADGKPQFDVNIMGYYDEKIGLGLQYRNNDALVGILRIEIIRGLRIAYSYDYGIKSQQAFGHNSHELILSYGVKLAPPPAKKEIHPRYYF